tara:strand:+ start:12309 stop:13373 length:1065 start_codon:yes stop_codon:yes gene_type:complete
MEIGLGLDSSLRLSLDEQNQLCETAARLGFSSIWTPEGTGQDSYQICLRRWEATTNVIPNGLITGIAVSPVIWRSPMAFAMAGGTISQITNGKFIMGLGSGGTYRPGSMNNLGKSKISPLSLMRDYVTIVRKLVNGETVSYIGEIETLLDEKLAISPAPKTPIYLGALGPKMLSLAGELADGAALNWCNAEQVAWSREQVKLGAEKSSRDPSEIKISEYIRICVDDEDENRARIALAKATMGYALGPTVPTEKEKQLGYRAHFERMGFAKELADLDQMRIKGASSEEIADAFPTNILNAVGYFGSSEGAAKAFVDLSQGLDNALVRVVSSRPGTINGTLDVMKACSPEKIRRSL